MNNTLFNYNALAKNTTRSSWINANDVKLTASKSVIVDKQTTDFNFIIQYRASSGSAAASQIRKQRDTLNTITNVSSKSKYYMYAYIQHRIRNGTTVLNPHYEPYYTVTCQFILPSKNIDQAVTVSESIINNSNVLLEAEPIGSVAAARLAKMAARSANKPVVPTPEMQPPATQTSIDTTNQTPDIHVNIHELQFKVGCTCPDFYFRCEQKLHDAGYDYYNYDVRRNTFNRAKTGTNISHKNQHFYACKHIHAVLNNGNLSQLANNIIKNNYKSIEARVEKTLAVDELQQITNDISPVDTKNKFNTITDVSNITDSEFDDEEFQQHLQDIDKVFINKVFKSREDLINSYKKSITNDISKTLDTLEFKFNTTRNEDTKSILSTVINFIKTTPKEAKIFKATDLEKSKNELIDKIKVVLGVTTRLPKWAVTLVNTAIFYKGIGKRINNIESALGVSEKLLILQQFTPPPSLLTISNRCLIDNSIYASVYLCKYLILSLLQNNKDINNSQAVATALQYKLDIDSAYESYNSSTNVTKQLITNVEDVNTIIQSITRFNKIDPVILNDIYATIRLSTSDNRLINTLRLLNVTLDNKEVSWLYENIFKLDSSGDFSKLYTLLSNKLYKRTVVDNNISFGTIKTEANEELVTQLKDLNVINNMQAISDKLYLQSRESSIKSVYPIALRNVFLNIISLYQPNITDIYKRDIEASTRKTTTAIAIFKLMNTIKIAYSSPITNLFFKPQNLKSGEMSTFKKVWWAISQIVKSKTTIASIIKYYNIKEQSLSDRNYLIKISMNSNFNINDIDSIMSVCSNIVKYANTTNYIQNINNHLNSISYNTTLTASERNMWRNISKFCNSDSNNLMMYFNNTPIAKSPSAEFSRPVFLKYNPTDLKKTDYLFKSSMFSSFYKIGMSNTGLSDLNSVLSKIITLNSQKANTIEQQSKLLGFRIRNDSSYSDKDTLDAFTKSYKFINKLIKSNYSSEDITKLARFAVSSSPITYNSVSTFAEIVSNIIVQSKLIKKANTEAFIKDLKYVLYLCRGINNHKIDIWRNICNSENSAGLQLALDLMHRFKSVDIIKVLIANFHLNATIETLDSVYDLFKDLRNIKTPDNKTLHDVLKYIIDMQTITEFKLILDEDIFKYLYKLCISINVSEDFNKLDKEIRGKLLIIVNKFHKTCSSNGLFVNAAKSIFINNTSLFNLLLSLNLPQPIVIKPKEIEVTAQTKTKSNTGSGRGRPSKTKEFKVPDLITNREAQLLKLEDAAIYNNINLAHYIDINVMLVEKSLTINNTAQKFLIALHLYKVTEKDIQYIFDNCTSLTIADIKYNFKISDILVILENIITKKEATELILQSITIDKQGSNEFKPNIIATTLFDMCNNTKPVADMVNKAVKSKYEQMLFISADVDDDIKNTKLPIYLQNRLSRIISNIKIKCQLAIKDVIEFPKLDKLLNEEPYIKNKYTDLTAHVLIDRYKYLRPYTNHTTLLIKSLSMINKLDDRSRNEWLDLNPNFYNDIILYQGVSNESVISLIVAILKSPEMLNCCVLLSADSIADTIKHPSELSKTTIIKLLDIMIDNFNKNFTNIKLAKSLIFKQAEDNNLLNSLEMLTQQSSSDNKLVSAMLF